jgi:hypothetical protein
MANPTPGDADYYDYVTKTGKYATKKKSSTTKKKPMAKKKDMLSEATSDAEKRKKQFSGGLAGMLGL